MRLASGLLAIGLGLGATAGWAGPAKTPAFPVQFGGPFELVDHHGQPRSDHEFRGRFLLLFFGYTHCPDICPTGLQTITEALEMLGARAGKLQPLFVSVDPRRDGPAVLKDYVGNFHPGILGLTGSEAQVRAAARAYRVHRRKVVPRDAEGPDDYLVDHGSLTYLMAPDGRFLTLFPFNTTPGSMAKTIAKYLNVESG